MVFTDYINFRGEIDGFYLGRGLIKNGEDGVSDVGMFLLPGVCPLLQFGFMCVVRCCHASGLLLLGDGDQGASGNRPASPAIVADPTGLLSFRPEGDIFLHRHLRFLPLVEMTR